MSIKYVSIVLFSKNILLMTYFPNIDIETPCKNGWWAGTAAHSDGDWSMIQGQRQGPDKAVHDPEVTDIIVPVFK